PATQRTRGPRAMADGYRRYIATVLRCRWTVLAATAFLTAVLAYRGIPLGLSAINSNPDGMFPPDHPYVQNDRRIRKDFGGWNYVVMIVEAKTGDVWKPEVLSVVDALTSEVRLLPGVIPTSIVSLASPNVRVVEDRGTGLDIRYLMRAVPRDAGEIDALKRQVL